jgi:hypothetical protein
MKKLFTTRAGKISSAILAGVVVGAATLGGASAANAHGNKKPSPKSTSSVSRTHTPRPTQAVSLRFVERQDVFIAGSTTLGSTIVVSPGILEPVADTVSYQWQRNGVAIVGATAASYVVTADDQGKQLRVIETSVKAGYKTETEHSNRLWIPAAV